MRAKFYIEETSTLWVDKLRTLELPFDLIIIPRLYIYHTTLVQHTTLLQVFTLELMRRQPGLIHTHVFRSG